MELLQRYDKGDLIHPSLVSMARFEKLLNTLASGDMPLAQEYAKCLGGRTEAEERYNSEFALSLGYSLKYAIGNKEMLPFKYVKYS